MLVVNKHFHAQQFLASISHQATAIFLNEEGILVKTQTQDHQLPLLETISTLTGTLESAYLNMPIVIKCTIHLTQDQLHAAGLHIYPLKAYLSQSDPLSQAALIKAYHWLQWDTQTQYCCSCGKPLAPSYHCTEKKCPNCQHVFFPRFSPAVMVLIQKENHILLARSPHFTKGVYSAIAGFVELGESAEMAIHREAEEEVGLKITNLQYFASQTWPFPDSFMLAFTATYQSGKLNIDKNELEEARWFTVDQLPTLPNQASIARKLIDSVVCTLI